MRCPKRTLGIVSHFYKGTHYGDFIQRMCVYRELYLKKKNNIFFFDPKVESEVVPLYLYDG